jgi:hypothetical protein
MTARADGEPPHVIFGDCLSGSASRVKVTVEKGGVHKAVGSIRSDLQARSY